LAVDGSIKACTSGESSAKAFIENPFSMLGSTTLAGIELLKKSLRFILFCLG
jgi:hypothetical protein